MCANTFDHYYPAYGGIRPRADMTGGRVGSAFRDAAAVGVAGDGAPSDGGEQYDEYGAPDDEDPRIYDEQLPPFDEGYYDESGVGPLDEGPVEQLPTPTEADPNDPLDMGRPAPALDDGLQIPDLPELGEAIESNAMPLP